MNRYMIIFFFIVRFCCFLCLSLFYSIYLVYSIGQWWWQLIFLSALFTTNSSYDSSIKVFLLLFYYQLFFFLFIIKIIHLSYTNMFFSYFSLWKKDCLTHKTLCFYFIIGISLTVLILMNIMFCLTHHIWLTTFPYHPITGYINHYKLFVKLDFASLVMFCKLWKYAYNINNYKFIYIFIYIYINIDLKGKVYL